MRQKISIGGRKNQIVIRKQLRIWKKLVSAEKLH